MLTFERDVKQLEPYVGDRYTRARRQVDVLKRCDLAVVDGDSVIEEIKGLARLREEDLMDECRCVGLAATSVLICS